ncbi:MAG TPA: DUF4239 domain-containing protein [Polyangia bacterium]
MLAHALFLVFLLLLFAGMVGCQLLGYRVAHERRARGVPPLGDGTTAVTGSLFALLGLLIAFSISGGQDRLEARRRLIVEEANAIETAYLRLDLLPAAAQPALRDDFRRYVDARIAFYAHFLDFDHARAQHRRAGELQRTLWKDAVAAAAQAPDMRAALLLIPSMNAMLDVTTARDAALRSHVPFGIFALLVVLSFVCAFFAGTEMSNRERPSTLHVLTFAGTLALTTYVIVNVELPRLGFAHLGPFDALLAQVRQRMG